MPKVCFKEGVATFPSGKRLGYRGVTIAVGKMEMAGDLDKSCFDSLEKNRSLSGVGLEENEK